MKIKSIEDVCEKGINISNEELYENLIQLRDYYQWWSNTCKDLYCMENIDSTKLQYEPWVKYVYHTRHFNYSCIYIVFCHLRICIAVMQPSRYGAFTNENKKSILKFVNDLRNDPVCIDPRR